ncbi:MFS transporter [Ferrimicrobium acidiphilum]|uniref:MFS transporter n=2 Tax=Ferrimicrobium acidiphilum TaxID=121039 RepID=UPI0023F07D15|nr:MFS transporter [Ferrimicrobium acidiphilum]
MYMYFGADASDMRTQSHSGATVADTRFVQRLVVSTLRLMLMWKRSATRASRAIPIAGAGIVLGSYDLAVISVALAPIRTQWHLSSGVVASLGTVTLLGMLIGSLTAGFLADRIGRRAIILWDVLLFMASAVMAAFSPDFALLAVARLATGVAVGIDFAVVFPFVTDAATSNNNGSSNKGRSMAWILFGANFGTLAAYGVGGMVLADVGALGWRVLLGSSVLLALPLLLFRSRLIEAPSWSELTPLTLRQLRRRATVALKHERLGAQALATLLYQLTDQGVGLVLPLLLVTILETSASSGALDAVLVKVVTIPASLVAVLLIDRVSRRRLQVTGFLGRAVPLCLLGFALLYNIHLSPLIIGLLLAAGYFFGAAGPDKTTVISPSEYAAPEIRATSQGLSQAAGRLGGILGVTGYAILVTLAGPGAGILLFGVACLLGAVISLAALPRLNPIITVSGDESADS